MSGENDLVKELDSLLPSENGTSQKDAIAKAFTKKTEKPNAPTSTLEVKAPEESSFVPTGKVTRNLDQIIEEMAEKRKQQWIDASYRKLEQLLYQVDNPPPVPSLPQPVPANEVVLRQIDFILMNKEPVTKKDLYNIKRQLKGESVSDAEFPEWNKGGSTVSSKQSTRNAKSKGIPIKVALAAFVLFMVAGIAIIIILTQTGLI
jgi:hypothetical protein